MRPSRLFAAPLALLLAGCSTSPQTPYSPSDDAGNPPSVDSGGPPVSTADGGTDATVNAPDSGPLPDGAPPDATIPVQTAWTGRPPAAPLVVRTPYMSTWMAGDTPNGEWPSFWTGTGETKAITCIARVDGAAYVAMGNPTGLSTPTSSMALVGSSLTPTKTEYVLGGGGITLTLDFLSPVEPSDIQKQSEPIAYITATAASSDGASHTVSVYFDISGEWANGDSTTSIDWARETVPHTGGNLVVQSFTPSAPAQLTENNQYPSWGTAFLAADQTSALTYAIGEDTVLRSMAASTGALDGSLDSDMPRAIDTNWPVLGFSYALGSVTSAGAAPVTLVIGHERNPAITYLGASVSPLWASYWSTWETMVGAAFDDYPAAVTRNAALDARVVSDATAAGGSHYAALCTLALRQAFAGTELVGTSASPWLMLKEISSDGNVSTVDVVYPASPVFLYTNPLLLKLMLDPLLQYAETGGWPKTFAEHDLGSAYPNAAGHNDGNEEDMPVEESANMLLMMAAYAQRATAADAKAYATAHYTIATQWAGYLEANALDPVNQNQTDDFTGFIDHSVNLALKGILGIGAMSLLAEYAGNTTDQQTYASTAKSYIATWATKAQDTAGDHLMLTYDEDGGAALSIPVQTSWSLKYNALYDKILGLDLIPSSVLAEEATWYAKQMQTYGVLLDPRNSWQKTDWALWTAGAVDDLGVRQQLIDTVYLYATTSTARVPFGDLYCVQTGTNTADKSSCTAGQWHAFQARPVQGGIFSLLATSGTSIVPP